MATVAIDLMKALEEQTIHSKDFNIEMWPYNATKRLEEVVEFLKIKQGELIRKRLAEYE